MSCTCRDQTNRRGLHVLCPRVAPRDSPSRACSVLMQMKGRRLDARVACGMESRERGRGLVRNLDSEWRAPQGFVQRARYARNRVLRTVPNRIALLDTTCARPREREPRAPLARTAQASRHGNGGLEVHLVRRKADSWMQRQRGAALLNDARSFRKLSTLRHWLALGTHSAPSSVSQTSTE